MTSDKDRLIELFSPFADGTYNSSGTIIDGTKVDDVADYLLANGVFLLPRDLRGTEDFSISAFIEAMQMYKEKDRYIKLPCKVGAEIFGLFDNDDEHIKEIYCGKVLCFSLDECNLLWARMKYACGLTYWHKIDDFGKKVFLTKEEVERALEEQGK